MEHLSNLKTRLTNAFDYLFKATFTTATIPDTETGSRRETVASTRATRDLAIAAYIASAQNALKRRWEEAEEEEEEISRALKRPRWDSDISSDDDSVTSGDGQVFWTDPVWDDSEDSSSDWAPSSRSSEDDDAQMTIEDLREAQRYQETKLDTEQQGYVSCDLNESDTDSDDNGIRWADYPTQGSDSDDSDYTPLPPDCTLEDMADFTSPIRHGYPKPYYAELDTIHPMNELLETGYMSDGAVAQSCWRDLASLRRKEHHMYLLPDHLQAIDDTIRERDLRTHHQPPPRRRLTYYTDLDSRGRPSPYFRKPQTKGPKRGAETRIEQLESIITDNHEYLVDDREWMAFEEI